MNIPITCKECGQPIDQTPGKRAKEFCNAPCRSNYWQKEHRKIARESLGKEAEGPPKKGAKGKFDAAKKTVLAMKEKGELPPIKSIPADQRKALLAKDVRRQPMASKECLVIPEDVLPTDPQKLLRMAKAGVPDKDAFKKHVDTTKMTNGQRTMIHSKLNG